MSVLGSPRLGRRRMVSGLVGAAMGLPALRSLAVAGGALAPRKPHFPARAKRVIFLFMAGGPSQLELFDEKPALTKFDGSLPPAALLQNYRAAFINPNSRLMGTRFGFKPAGRSGTPISDLLPHFARVVDDVALIRSMKTDAFNHAPAQILLNAGTTLFGRPTLGAWATFGLGTENPDLPGYVVLQSGLKGPSGGAATYASGFLPSVHQGVPLRSGGDPVLYLSNPRGLDDEAQRATLRTLRTLNERHLKDVGDEEIASRIETFELAYRMQKKAPELVDITRESKATLALYGAEPHKASFANNCLLARRLVESGVRFVQLTHEAWDHHGGLREGLVKECASTDRATAALLTDLKQRGLLEDTLVMWGGEFGRTPMVQGASLDGRDHHPNAFTMWVAGGGVRAGQLVGETDELGFEVVRQPVHVHDLQATILHLLGFDHERLTFRFQGRDFRLTDVAGKVVKELLS